MRQIPTIIVSLFIGVISCDSPKDKKPITQDTPKALEEKSLERISSKRGNGDLVDNIYDELVSKSPALEDIENNIAKVQESKNDSLSSFNKYDDKNRQYYSSVG